MILWIKHQRLFKLLNCLHKVVMTIFLWSVLRKICSIKINALFRLNSDYMVIFKNLQDNSQFATIARQVRPDKMKFLLWAYKDETSSLHTYLILYLKPDSEERFWERSNILEDLEHAYITHWKRKRLICKVTMVLSACLRTLRRTCLCS